jgi:hypothetical protein
MLPSSSTCLYTAANTSMELNIKTIVVRKLLMNLQCLRITAAFEIVYIAEYGLNYATIREPVRIFSRVSYCAYALKTFETNKDL